MGQYAESDIVLESNSLLRAVFFIPKNKERQVTIMRQAVTTVSEILSYLVTQMVKNLSAIQETHIRSLGSNGKIL